MRSKPEECVAKLIYAADDDSSVGAVLQKVLSKAGFYVEFFGDAEALINATLVRTPDLIVLDIEMPGKGGLNALAALKKAPETAHVPIIMLTSKSKRETVLEALNHKADDYILKPFDHKDLVKRAFLHTFEFAVEEIQALLLKCNLSDMQALKRVGLREFQNKGYDCYPIDFVHFPICILVRTGKIPSDLAEFSNEQLKNYVMIFGKGALWMPVWPSRTPSPEPELLSEIQEPTQEVIDSLVSRLGKKK